MDQASGGLMQIGFLVFFVVVMYLLLIRPQRKKEKAVNEMRNSLQVGDEVITIGGICGKIVKTRPESLIIQVGAEKVKFEVMRWGISRVTEQSKPRKSRYEEDDAEETNEKKKALPKRMKKSQTAAQEETDTENFNSDDYDEEDEK